MMISEEDWARDEGEAYVRRDASPFPPENPKYSVPVPPKGCALQIFLHVNSDLNDFQKDALCLLLCEENQTQDLANLLILLKDAVEVLEEANFKPEKVKSDSVNRPSHYDRYPMEPTYYSMEFGLDICRFNALKYICRYPYKNGIEDLRKAARYVAMYIRWLDGDPNWSK